MRTPGLIALGIAAATLAACQQPKQLSYQEAYEQRLYDQALDKASLVAGDDHAPDRSRAALVAGMSAQALGKTSEAKQYLAPLRVCPDKDIAARAKASLGLIAKGEGKNAEAVVLLKSSAEQLDGDDAAQAQLNAGDAYRKLGLEAQAREAYANAKTEAEDPTLRAAADQKSRPQTFFVQCGAYSTRQAAERQVKAIRAKVIKAGQPAPAIIQLNPNGTPLFVVQVGPYRDRQAAMVARGRIGLDNTAVLARQ
ncbi:MAG: SPOR domain-containing protein [Phycisphaerales bacterium]|nr:SPOR domain-containing protein [Phycisphaerales bacterium]